MQGDQVGVPGQVVNLVVIHRQVAGAGPGSAIVENVPGQLSFVIPDQVPGGGIPGLDVIAAGVGNVHDALIYQRPDLLPPRIHSPHPGQLQPVHIAAIDLVQWRVPGKIEGAVVHQPVLRIRIQKHLVGNGNEGFLLVLSCHPRHPQDRTQQGSAEGPHHTESPLFRNQVIGTVYRGAAPTAMG